MAVDHRTPRCYESAVGLLHYLVLDDRGFFLLGVFKGRWGSLKRISDDGAPGPTREVTRDVTEQTEQILLCTWGNQNPYIEHRQAHGTWNIDHQQEYT